MRLAHALQRDGFPNVCVLDGGFPALVEQLLAWRGTVEPVIINHDPNKWRHFLQTTGRQLPSAGSSSKPKDKSLEKEAKTSSSSHHGSFLSTGAAPVDTTRRRSQMTEVEIAQMAYKVAVRLGHKHMEVILLERINDAIMHEEQSPALADTLANRKSRAGAGNATQVITDAHTPSIDPGEEMSCNFRDDGKDKKRFLPYIMPSYLMS